MPKTFNDITLSVFAFNAGKAYSAAQNVIGNTFFSAFSIADAIGFDRDSLEWRSAVSGAMLHIKDLDVWTNQNGTMIEAA